MKCFVCAQPVSGDHWFERLYPHKSTRNPDEILSMDSGPRMVFCDEHWDGAMFERDEYVNARLGVRLPTA